MTGQRDHRAVYARRKARAAAAGTTVHALRKSDETPMTDVEQAELSDEEWQAFAEGAGFETGLPVQRAHEPVYGTTVLAIPEGLTLDQWTEIGAHLATAVNSTPWWVGDWIIYAHTTFETDDDGNAISTGGAAVRVRLAELGFEHETIDRCRRVAAKFPPSARHETLSWAHHLEVAALEPDDAHRLLHEAATEAWSTRDLRERVRRLTAIDTQEALPGLARPVRMSLVLKGVTDAAVIDRVEARLNAVLAEFGIEGQVKVA
jgi:hypothetical protein